MNSFDPDFISPTHENIQRLRPWTKAEFHRFLQERENDLATKNEYPPGAARVLDVLRERLGDWILRDDIQARTGQRNVRSRVDELRHRGGFDIECNKQGGRRTAYRLVNP